MGFDSEVSALYTRLAENHRHEKGPWLLMNDKVKSKLKNLKADTELKIVDIASGPGEPALTIAKSMPHATVFSTDVSVDMHKIAAIQSVQVKNFKSMVLDALDLSAFASGSVDVVTCCYGFMFPEDKVKCLSEVYRILKPGGILVNTHWKRLDMMLIGKEIIQAIYESKNLVPPKPPINPLALAEPGLFDRICMQGGFKKENIETQESTYPFNLGSDPETAYKMVTIPIKPLIEEHQGQAIARKVYDGMVEQYTVYDKVTKNRSLPQNIFVMTTITK